MLLTLTALIVNMTDRVVSVAAPDHGAVAGPCTVVFLPTHTFLLKGGTVASLWRIPVASVAALAL